MTLRLKTLLAEAEALPEDRQDDLADLVEAFLASAEEPSPFTPDELEHIARIEAEPFVEVDPDEIAATFARRRG